MTGQSVNPEQPRGRGATRLELGKKSNEESNLAPTYTEYRFLENVNRRGQKSGSPKREHAKDARGNGLLAIQYYGCCVVDSYNQGRPHLSLGPGIPEPTAVFLPLQGHDRHTFAQDCKVAARAVLGGLHHEYRWERIAA
jgi:hypothetical protein